MNDLNSIFILPVVASVGSSVDVVVGVSSLGVVVLSIISSEVEVVNRSSADTIK